MNESSGNGAYKTQNKNTKQCKLKHESMLGLQVVRAHETYYPHVFLKECKFIKKEKNVIKYIL